MRASAIIRSRYISMLSIINRSLSCPKGILSALTSTDPNSWLTVLMYHEVLDDEWDVGSWLVVKRSEFKKQMAHLKTNFHIVSIQEALDDPESLGINKKQSVILTFDDGYAGNSEAAFPILKEMEIPFTIFCATEAIESQIPYWYDRVIRALLCNRDVVKFSLGEPHPKVFRFNGFGQGENKWDEIQCMLTYLKSLPRIERAGAVEKISSIIDPLDTDYPVRPLTIAQLKEIAGCELATIGAHSHTHDILVQLSTQEARTNIETSHRKLGEWTGRSIDFFSYPNGDYDGAILNAVRDLGFKAAFTTEERKWKSGTDLYSIPRLGIGRFDSFDSFKAKLKWSF